MPIRRGKDKKGCFYQWGGRKKYYYKCGSKNAAARAKKKAEAQAKAIYSSGWREPKW